MKRWTGLLAILLAILTGAPALGEGSRVAEGNAANFGKLLVVLLHAYERPSPEDASAIEEALAAIGAVDSGDYQVARAIADHWNAVCVNADGAYRMYVYGGEERATELEQSGLKDSPTHAFVVLGYELKNGELRDELKGRCRAAAAAARSFPSAILVCTGGPSGKNNPEGHTEAGMMKRYLVEQCGIDAGRIFTEEQAMTTAENALNTLEILRAQGIETMTVITSTYHQKRGQVLYNAVAALCGRAYGYCPALVANYSYSIANGNKKNPEDRLAVQQLASVLGLPDDVVRDMRARF